MCCVKLVKRNQVTIVILKGDIENRKQYPKSIQPKVL